jgi:23S rRNA-/tRNA-specific pseudouridylate synthase
VEGVVTEPGAIRTPIAHHPKNKRKMILPQDEAEAKKFKARPALTEYEVVKTTERHSLLRVILTKGNRHQIRIHLASLGHPVVGDALYGKKTDGPERNYLLHAHRVHFRHPFTQQKLTLTAPVPGDFAP